MAIAIPIAAAAVTAGASIYSANQSSDAIQNSSQAQTDSNAAALALNKAQADRTDAEFAPWRTVGAGALQMLARTEGIQVPANTFSYYNLPASNSGTPASAAPGGGPAPPGAPGAGTAQPAAPQLVTPGVSAGQAYLNANPDVLAEYNRILPTVDWNSPWAAQHGFVQGDPGAFGDWHYQNHGQAEGRAAGVAVAPVYSATPAAGATAPPPTAATAPTPTGAVDINGQPILSTTGKPTGMAATPKGAPAGSDPRYGDFFASPDYQFRLDEGSRAITGNKAAKGLLDSGSLGTGLIKFGQNEASGEFGSWYNRIAALAGVGQTAVNQSATSSANSTAAQTGIIQAQGANTASSIAAQGGVNAGLINNIGNTAAGLIRNIPSQTSQNPNIDAAAINAGAVDFGRAVSGGSGGLFGPPI